MTLKKIALITSLLLSLSLFTACTGDDIKEPVSKKVVYEELEKGRLELQNTYTGTVIPSKESYVSAKYDGQILEIFVDIGDTVKKGDPIFEIDAEASEIMVDNLKEQLRLLKYQKETVEYAYEVEEYLVKVNIEELKKVKKALNSLYKTQISNINKVSLENLEDLNDQALEVLEDQLDTLEDIKLENAEARKDSSLAIFDEQIKQAEDSNLDDQVALLEKQREDALLEIEGNIEDLKEQIEIFEEEIEKAEIGFESSEDSIQIQLSQIRKELALKEAEIDAEIKNLEETLVKIDAQKLNSAAEINLSINQLDGQLKSQKLMEDYAISYAPYSGVITEKYLELGDLAAIGTPVFKISTEGNYKVLLEIPDNFVASLENVEDIEVELGLDGATEILDAEILKIHPKMNANSHNVKLELLVEKSSDLIEGAFVKVAFYSKSQKGFILKNSAIISRYGRDFIYLYKSGIAKELEIEILEKNDENTLIDAEIDENAKVITKGNEYLRNGDKVQSTTLRRR